MYPTPKLGTDKLHAAKLASTHKGTETRRQMLEYMRKHGEADAPALAAHLDLAVTSVRSQLRRLLRRGVIEQCGMIWTKPIYRERNKDDPAPVYSFDKM